MKHGKKEHVHTLRAEVVSSPRGLSLKKNTGAYGNGKGDIWERI